MKTTIRLELYSLDELEKEAQEKAYKYWKDKIYQFMDYQDAQDSVDAAIAIIDEWYEDFQSADVVESTWDLLNNFVLGKWLKENHPDLDLNDYSLTQIYTDIPALEVFKENLKFTVNKARTIRELIVSRTEQFIYEQEQGESSFDSFIGWADENVTDYLYTRTGKVIKLEDIKQDC